MLFDFTISSVMVSELLIEILKAPDFPYSPFDFYLNGCVNKSPITKPLACNKSVVFLSAIISNLMIYLVPYSVCCILVLHIDFMCPAKN